MTDKRPHRFGSLRVLWQLARWLGPWAPPTRRPRTLSRRTLTFPSPVAADRRGRAYLYRPNDRPATGSLFLLPGLHYDGPDDPRMVRFASILASTGTTVCTPFLTDFLTLRLRPTLIEECFDAFAAFLDHLPGPTPQPGVMSISFGSLPALRLAAHPEFSSRIRGVLLFGGFLDFEQVTLFALGAEGAWGDVPRDPLNRAVVYIHLVDRMRHRIEGVGPLRQAWLTFARQTWNIPAMKEPAAWQAVGEKIAESLDPEDRTLFRIGCGIEPAQPDIWRAALDASVRDDRFLDPRPQLPGVIAPVRIVHGRADEVIPVTEADGLARSLPEGARPQVHLTGVYGHSEVQGGQTGRGTETIAMLKILRAIAATCGL